MKQEEKQLLLQDICARLPYGVKCENYNHVYGKNVFKVTDIRDNGYICGVINSKHCWSVPDPLELKPYLFPLSSMTEEQKKELKELCNMYDPYHDYDNYENWGVEVFEKHIHSDDCRFTFTADVIDWLNKNHFDYHHLIERNLAIDCTNLNIY